MVNRPADAAEPDDSGHVRALEADGAVVYRGTGADRRARAGRGHPRRRHARDRRPRTSSSRSDRSRRSPPLEGIDDGPDLDEPRGHARPRAAGEPPRPRRRPDRLRARPGLRPVRRADDDRPVRAAPRPDRPPAQLRGGPAALERDGVTVRLGRPRAPGARGAHGRRAAHGRPRRRHDRDRATRSCWRSAARSRSTTSASSTTASTRAGGRPYPRDGRLRVADGLWIIGDPAGPELHTHQAPLPGRARGPDGAGRGGPARLPRPAAGDVHGPRGGVGRA